MNTDWMEFVHPNDCECYECAGSRINQNGSVINNVKHHTFGEPCDTCGKEKTEYRDLGRKGYYVCWFCTERAGGSP